MPIFSILLMLFFQNVSQGYIRNLFWLKPKNNFSEKLRSFYMCSTQWINAILFCCTISRGFSDSLQDAKSSVFLKCHPEIVLCFKHNFSDNQISSEHSFREDEWSRLDLKVKNGTWKIQQHDVAQILPQSLNQRRLLFLEWQFGAYYSHLTR